MLMRDMQVSQAACEKEVVNGLWSELKRMDLDGALMLAGQPVFDNPKKWFGRKLRGKTTDEIGEDWFKRASEATDRFATLWCGKECCTFAELVTNCMLLYGGWPEDMHCPERVDVAKVMCETQFSRDAVVGLTDAKREAAIRAKRVRLYEMKRFAGKMLSKLDLMDFDGEPNRSFEYEILAAYLACRASFERDRQNFTFKDGVLYGKRDVNGVIPWYIRRKRGSAELEVSDEFYRFLVDQDAWTFANGAFEREMAKVMSEVPDVSDTMESLEDEFDEPFYIEDMTDEDSVSMRDASVEAPTR